MNDAAIGSLCSRMGVTRQMLLSSLAISPAAAGGKGEGAIEFSEDESSRVLGIEKLIALVQTMVEQSGNPDGFDAARWLAGWIAAPVPALGGRPPASYLATLEGQRVVADLLSMIQSGAFA